MTLDRDVKIGFAIGLVALALFVLVENKDELMPPDPAQVVPEDESQKPTDETPLAGPVVRVERGSPLEDYLDNVRFWELQLEAVATEMHLFLGWHSDEKAMIRKAGKEAVARLKDIKKQIRKVQPPSPDVDLSEGLRTVATALQGFYRKAARLDEAQRKAEHDTVQETYRAYGANRGRFQMASPTPDRKETECPKPEFASEEHEQKYQQAQELMEKRRYADALQILKELDGSYSMNGFILVDMAVCLAKGSLGRPDSADGAKSPEEEALDLLDQLMSSGQYSPVLAKAFLMWRTLTQTQFYGVSNYSEIPNWDYNERRMELVQVVKERLKEQPEDSWAYAQKEELLSLPNIERGGFMGNTNLFYWGFVIAGDQVGDALKKLRKDETPPGSSDGGQQL